MKIDTKQWGGASFSLPDEPTVFQIVAYDSVRFSQNGAPALITLWEMAKAIMSDWECEAFPDTTVPLEEVKDVKVARIIEWAGVQVSAWRRGLDTVSKN